MKLPLLLMCAFLLGSSLGFAASNARPAQLRVALVFDDGPHPEQGAILRKILAAEAINVTFAQVGRNVTRHPEVTQAAFEAGHEIVNHSQTHAQIGSMNRAAVAREVVEGTLAITTALGQPPAWYWPPYLAVTPDLVAALEEAELRLYLPHHLVDSRDWDSANISAEELYRRATTGVRDGSVILFHEWRVETAQQLPAILAELRRQGCVFYTFSQLAAELRERAPSEPADAATHAIFAPRQGTR